MIDHEPMPIGTHTSHECSWMREGDRLTLRCPLHNTNLDDLGTFEVCTDDLTRFIVDDVERPMDDAIGLYSELWGDTVLTVKQAGKLSVMEFGVRADV